MKELGSRIRYILRPVSCDQTNFPSVRFRDVADISNIVPALYDRIGLTPPILKRWAPWNI